MDDPEQLSPELALVDPELAERARASLPEEPWLAFGRPPRRRLRSRALVPVIREQAPGRERRRPVAAVLVAAAVIAVLVVLAFGLLPSPGPRPSFEPVVARSQAAQPPAPAAAPPSPVRPATRARPRSVNPPSPPPSARPPSASPSPARPPAASPPAAEPAPPPAPRQPPSAPPAEPPAAPPAAPKPPPPAAPKPPPPAAPKPPPPAAPKPPPPSRPPPPAAASSGGFQPARVFAWAPVPGATYYHVVFLRAGKRFYEGFSAGPRITLPRTVRFVAGTYTWTVRPGTGPRAARNEGAPIVESTFTIEG